MFLTSTLLTLAAGAPAVPAEPQPLAAPLYVPADADGEWHGSVNLGATISSGNSDIVTAAASADGQKEWDDNRLTLRAAWVFAQQTSNATGLSSVTQRQWNASAKFDHFYNEETYSYASVRGENDDIALLHLRTIASVGMGHKFVDEEDFMFEGEAGLAYVDENYATPPPPAPDADDSYMALRLATNLKKVLSESTTFLQTAEAYPSLSFSEFNGVVDSRLKIDLSESMHALIQWIVKYNNNQPVGTGSTDSLWIFSLGWTY